MAEEVFPRQVGLSPLETFESSESELVAERLGGSHPGTPSFVVVEKSNLKSDFEDESIPSLDVSVEVSVDRRRRSWIRMVGFSVVFSFLATVSLGRAGVLENEFRIEDVVSQEMLARINGTLPSMTYLTHETKRPGFRLAEQGAKPHYPIVMVPGFVTSGLELWEGHECAKKFFRQRLWAALSGARTFLSERSCWKEHMMLDPFTGGDPEGIKLRASQGFEATDYFLGNYWVWGKLIVNLADLGYSPSTMAMEPYDWRLSFPMLEERDGYLTNLKHRIEALHKTNGKKVILASHSMGGLLVHYFFAWVTTSERNGGGGGGTDWVERHIHTYINIAGSHLGVPKAATALLSGEMSDTIFTGTMENMVEQFFGRRLRRDLWTTWGSIWSMLPKGGNAIWGIGADMCNDTSTDEDFCPKGAMSPLLRIQDEIDYEGVEQGEHLANLDARTRDHEETATERLCYCPGKANSTDARKQAVNLARDFSSKDSVSVEDVNKFLLGYGSGFGRHTAASRDLSLFGTEKASSRTWHDPTRTPLPTAPSMRIYCLYGVGLETERAYFYQRREDDPDVSDLATPEPPVFINPSVHDEDRNIQYGTKYADGDGSVPLVSLGLLCADAWQRSETGLNPANSPVTTREYRHTKQTVLEDPMRGGPGSAEHVDILGNVDMTEDFLRIVSDFEVETIQEDRIVSDIKSIAAGINAHPHGGIGIKKSWKKYSPFHR